MQSGETAAISKGMLIAVRGRIMNYPARQAKLKFPAKMEIRQSLAAKVWRAARFVFAAVFPPSPLSAP